MQPFRHVHIFRQDLRLHDNHALSIVQNKISELRSHSPALLADSCVVFVYLLDLDYLIGKCNLLRNRLEFMSHCLHDLSHQLTRDIQSKLIVTYHSDWDTDSLITLINENKIGSLSFNMNPEDKWRGFERRLMSMSKSPVFMKPLEMIIGCNDIFDHEEIIRLNSGRLPPSFKDFIRIVSTSDEIMRPTEDTFCARLDGLGHVQLEDTGFEDFCIQKLRRCLGLAQISTTLLQLEGETLALKNVSRMISGRMRWPEMSKWMTFGALSCRMLAEKIDTRLCDTMLRDPHEEKCAGTTISVLLHKLECQNLESTNAEDDNEELRIRQEANDFADSVLNSVDIADNWITLSTQERVGSTISKQMSYDMSFFTEVMSKMISREYFYICAYNVPNFTKVKNNMFCRELAWHTPSSPYYRRRMQAVQDAATGYPYIDACLSKMFKMGYLRQHERLAIANYITRGQLNLPWDFGQRLFEKNLIDADYAINAGNWAWTTRSSYRSTVDTKLTSSAASSAYYFSARYDKNALFIKEWHPKDVILLVTASADDRISANELTLLHKPYLMWENAVKKYFEVDKKRDSGGHDLLGQSDMTSYSRGDEEATRQSTLYRNCVSNLLRQGQRLSGFDSRANYLSRLHARLFLFPPHSKYYYDKEWVAEAKHPEEISPKALLPSYGPFFLDRHPVVLKPAQELIHRYFKEKSNSESSTSLKSDSAFSNAASFQNVIQSNKEDGPSNSKKLRNGDE